MIRSEKLQNESSPNFSNFGPEFCLEFSPNFPRIFRASFRLKRRPQKIHSKSPPFFNAKFAGKHEQKTFTKFFWRGGKVKNSAEPLGFCRKVLQKISHSKKSVEEKLCRTPKVLQNFGEPNPAFQALRILLLPFWKIPGNSRKCKQDSSLDEDKSSHRKAILWRTFWEVCGGSWV